MVPSIDSVEQITAQGCTRGCLELWLMACTLSPVGLRRSQSCNVKSISGILVYDGTVYDLMSLKSTAARSFLGLDDLLNNRFEVFILEP